MTSAVLQSVVFGLGGALIMGLGAPLYKKLTEKVGKLTFDKFMKNPWKIISAFILSPLLYIAIACGGGGWALWVRGLSLGEATIVGPMLAGMYVSSLVVSVTWLKERLTRKEILGVFAILVGIVILALAGGISAP